MEVGHNSYAVTADELRQFVERIERQEDEVALARADLKDIFKEAKARGYDTKVLRKLVSLRKRKPDEIAEERAILEMYGAALGMDIFL